MGQLWRVLAPGRKETTGILGELAEVLLSGSASGLVALLAVPVNTHRYQNVEIVPGENIEDNEDEDFECTKRIRTSDLSQNHSSKAVRIEHHDRNIREARNPDFTSLSSDLHHKIFSNLDTIEDVLRLSLANKYFWAVGLAHIEDHIVESLAPWAGERIICVSDQTDPSDYPSDILDPAEQDDIRELNKVYHLESFSIRNTYKKIGAPSLSQELQRWFLDYEAKHHMSQTDRAEIMMGLKPEILEFYPRDQRWILRNLTTKEYVRGEVIALKEEFIHGPQIDVIGFSEILISRISWSSQPERVGWSENITKGKWAGHRFDITPLSLHEERSKNEVWEDVSDEILREIDLIIGGEHGDDWRDLMARQYRKIVRPTLEGFS
ncbi:hypothetical protein N7462_001414 [Penicillium macrosclerotiorum]|uniref:uncharacterized protein n=1 Tax=Penicillium macrosclerotiorum TaxID=303699 RepID=UPI0025467022|nr:uncharacterized protein N7462_001414 [Penicillium macrosclerotiorum]KAJ5691991.1 hypothetical protein N7462_001414 [Penicillium macrosclerotiorum]